MLFKSLLKLLKRIIPLPHLGFKTLFIGFSMLFFCNGYGQQKNFYIDKQEPSWIVGITPKNIRPAAKDISEGYFLSFYENQNHLELKEDYTHIIREIVSDAGVQNGSQISVTYDPGFQKLVFHKILIWRNGKATDKLVKSDFKLLQSEKELSRFIYSGTFDAFMLLDDVRKGDRIEFSYTLKGINPIFGNKYSSVYYFEGGSSIGHLYSNVIFDKSRTLSLKDFGYSGTNTLKKKDGMNMYEWETTLTKTHRTSDYEPSWYNPMRRTQLTEYKSWEEVVDWALKVNDYPNLKSPLLAKKVKELKQESGNDDKKYITLATRFVQNEIRYMGIEIGMYSHRPNSPEKVLSQRYGDCKDKSLLLVHLLHAKGINAYMTYADTYSTIKTDQYLPSPFVFNHVIVMVDFNNYKTWIDPTISYQRGNFDNFYAPPYGKVLVVKKGVNGLEQMERKTVGKLIANMRFTLADTIADSKTTLLITSIYSDNYADELRAQIAESGTDGMEKSYLEYLTKLYPEVETKEPIKIEDDETANVIEVTESYDIANIWTENTEINDKVVYFYGDLINSELRKISGSKRIAPIAIKDDLNIEQNITVDMPYEVSAGDDSFHIENENYFFDIYEITRPREIKFSYTFRNSSGYIEPEKAKAYVKDIKKIDEYLTHYVKRNAVQGQTSGINFYTLLPYMICIALTAFFLIRLFRKHEPFVIGDIADALPIGGWLVLLAIRVALLPIILFAGVILADLFKQENWNGIMNFGKWEIILKFSFILEAIMYAMLFTYSIFCAILFFQRRKDFPKHFIILTFAHLLFLLFDLVLAGFMQLYLGRSFAEPSSIGNILGPALYGGIWIWYLLKSERVKQTFVFTYPKFAWEDSLSDYYENLYQEQTKAVSTPTLNDNSNNENI